MTNGIVTLNWMKTKDQLTDIVDEIRGRTGYSANKSLFPIRDLGDHGKELSSFPKEFYLTGFESYELSGGGTGLLEVRANIKASSLLNQVHNRIFRYLEREKSGEYTIRYLTGLIYMEELSDISGNVGVDINMISLEHEPHIYRIEDYKVN